MKLLQLASFLFFLTACNNSGNSNTQTVKTRADSLMDEVLEGHNVGMAKTSKIAEAQKKIQNALDSLSKLPGNLQKNSLAFKIQLDSALGRLKNADDAMNRWMEEFNMDSSLNNMERRIEYLESEKTKISNVRDDMIRSLKKADSLLKKS